MGRDVLISNNPPHGILGMETLCTKLKGSSQVLSRLLLLAVCTQSTSSEAQTSKSCPSAAVAAIASITVPFPALFPPSLPFQKPDEALCATAKERSSGNEPLSELQFPDH